MRQMVIRLRSLAAFAVVSAAVMVALTVGVSGFVRVRYLIEVADQARIAQRDVLAVKFLAADFTGCGTAYALDAARHTANPASRSALEKSFTTLVDGMDTLVADTALSDTDRVQVKTAAAAMSVSMTTDIQSRPGKPSQDPEIVKTPTANASSNAQIAHYQSLIGALTAVVDSASQRADRAADAAARTARTAQTGMLLTGLGALLAIAVLGAFTNNRATCRKKDTVDLVESGFKSESA